jgi:NAD(P)-dependent dehydrogenase (short-subunit alcohol dehydrogenase family)
VLFIGATSGIGQSALQHFSRHASSPHIYSVARPPSVNSHENLIAADVSLISEIDKIVQTITQKETKVDILFMSAGFIAFKGRRDTREGPEPSMTTRYYSRLRAVQKLLPMLNNASTSSSRIVSVLAGGMEGPLNERDLDLRDPRTLTLEKIARENPRLSVVHWFPGPVATPGLAKAQIFGMSPPNPSTQDDAGARAVFLATSDRYAVHGGLVPIPEGVGLVKKSGGGIFLVDPQGESADNEYLLADLRKRGVDKAVWSFTQEVFAACSKVRSSNDEL